MPADRFYLNLNKKEHFLKLNHLLNVYKTVQVSGQTFFLRGLDPLQPVGSKAVSFVDLYQ